MVAAKTAAAVRGSVDCCTGLGVPGQPWTAAAAAAAARAPLTACGDCVPPEPVKFSFRAYFSKAHAFLRACFFARTLFCEHAILSARYFERTLF